MFHHSAEHARAVELERRVSDLQRQLSQSQSGAHSESASLREQSTANRLRAEQAEAALSAAQSRVVAAAAEASRLQSQCSTLEAQLAQAADDLDAMRRQVTAGIAEAGRLAVAEEEREAWRRRAEGAEHRAASLTARVGQLEHGGRFDRVAAVTVRSASPSVLSSVLAAPPSRRLPCGSAVAARSRSASPGLVPPPPPLSGLPTARSPSPYAAPPPPSYQQRQPLRGASTGARGVAWDDEWDLQNRRGSPARSSPPRAGEPLDGVAWPGWPLSLPPASAFIIAD